MKLPGRRAVSITVLVIVLIAQTVFLALLYQSYTNYRKTASNQVSQLSAQLEVASMNAQMSRAVIDVKDNAVYLPELQLKLPLNPLSEQLVYSARTDMVKNGDPLPGADISTASDVAFVQDQPMRLACTPVRIAFGSATQPYSPSEKPLAPVKLADGRTIQIYVFQNSSCNNHWKFTGTTPANIGRLMQQATSY